MFSASPSELKFDIGHVLFIDIAGYSKLLVTDQSEQLQKLKEIVRGTEQVCLTEAETKLQQTRRTHDAARSARKGHAGALRLPRLLARERLAPNAAPLAKLISNAD